MMSRTSPVRQVKEIFVVDGERLSSSRVNLTIVSDLPIIFLVPKVLYVSLIDPCLDPPCEFLISFSLC